MKNFKEISRMTFEHDGGTTFWGKEVPYTRTWTLAAYDENDKLITAVSKSEKNNYIKYVKFINELKMKAYKLRPEDREILKNEDKNDGFLQKALIKNITWNNILEVADIAGVSGDHVELLKKCPIDEMKEEKIIFAECVGLEYDELIKAIEMVKKNETNPGFFDNLYWIM